MNIFVTVGTFSNEALISKIEEISTNQLNQYTLQTGNYKSKHPNSFQFKDSIRKELEQADLIITSGGSGTILEALELKKNVIVVINDTLQDNHQHDLVSRLEKEGYLRNVKVGKLEEAIKTKFKPKPWSSKKSDGSIKVCEILGNWITEID